MLVRSLLTMFNRTRDRLMAIVLLLATIWGCFSYFGLLDSTQEEREKLLIVGLQHSYPPYEFIDHTNTLVGFDLDIANLLAEKLHRKLVIKEMDFDQLLPSLKQGKIDIILSGMNITSDRLEEIAMVPYHGATTNTLRLLFWKNIPEEIKSLRDVAQLPGPKISAERGSVCELVLLGHNDLECVPYQGAIDPLADVKAGNAIATLVEQDIAEALQKQFPEIHSVRIPLNEDEQIMGFGIGIKKSHALLLHQVTEAVESSKKTYELKHLEDKWFNAEVTSSDESL